MQSHRAGKLAKWMGLALAVAVGCGGVGANASDSGFRAGETPAQKDARMAWWRDARFGMFIHWGVYSVPAGTYDGKRIPGIGEWIMNNGKIPVAEYAKFAEQFNPTKFNADEWVQTAQDAGMKYMVITSKHHDGFAMFHTKVDDYNIFDATPFKRDPLKELSEACQKHGMKLGFYYSQAQDWHHPGGAALHGGHWDKAQDGSFDDYLKNVAVPQVKEILSNYGPVAVIWWDTPVDMTPERAALFYPDLKLQPQIIMNNRLGGGDKGDYETPEQRIPPNGFPGDWETCMTINDTWGYKSYDTNFKSTERLLRNLIDIASKGGNYLLNVGPTSEGVIPEPETQRLHEMGQWLKTNGDAIYGTTRSPFQRTPFDGRCTVKGNTLYVHVFSWPEGGLQIKGLKSQVQSAKFLDGGADAETSASQDPDGTPVLTIKPPGKPDAIATVVALNLSGPPEVIETWALAPSADGKIVCNLGDADVDGKRIRYQNKKGVEETTNWTDPSDSVKWMIRVPSDGKYDVTLTYASDDDKAGSEYTINFANGGNVSGKVAGTGGATKFQDEPAGTVDLKSGRQTMTVKATNIANGGPVMELQKVVLTPHQ